MVFLADPRDIELILSSQVYLDKSPEYRFFKPWLGNGLLISSGECSENPISQSLPAACGLNAFSTNHFARLTKNESFSINIDKRPKGVDGEYLMPCIIKLISKSRYWDAFLAAWEQCTVADYEF